SIPNTYFIYPNFAVFLRVFVIEGESNVAGENLSRRDGIGIWDIESVTIEATSETQILAIEVAM
ncbi:hypothetical protein KSX17_10600, partial [Phocaeicola vulgatus]|nr:hypothetical protein [Phocaeicola vulgatus]MBV3510072.1 hypothetical protein [Phocaeicola vulgatus]